MGCSFSTVITTKVGALLSTKVSSNEIMRSLVGYTPKKVPARITEMCYSKVHPRSGRGPSLLKFFGLSIGSIAFIS